VVVKETIMQTLHRQLSHRAALLFATAIATTGCAPLEPEDVDTDDIGVVESAVVKKGTICAAGAGGKATCVPSGGSVDTAYQGAVTSCEASSKCAPPYDIWPNLPSGMSLQKGMRNKEALTQLLADMDRIMAYGRDSLSAEAYEQLMLGKLGQVVRQISEGQAAALARPDPTTTAPLEEFERSLRAKASAETDPLVMKLASDKQTFASIQKVVASVQPQLVAQQKAYTEIVKRFRAYKALEGAHVATLTEFSSRASQAALLDLPTVQMDVLKYVRASAETPNQLSLDAHRLRASMAQLESLFLLRLEPYRSFIEANLGEMPALTPIAQWSLISIVVYCRELRSQSDTQIASLFQGISARARGLIAAAADEKTRGTLRQAAHLKASAAFLDEATARDKETSKLPPKTAKYGFYLWAEKYDQYLAVLELEPLCGEGPNAPLPSWRDTGCVSFARIFGRAHTYTEKTIPQAIRLALSQLRAKGVAESLLSEIDAQLKAGSIRQAALSYDAAARLTEGM